MLPDGLVEIGGSWFADSSIESVSISSSVRIIREKAFYRCSKLSSVSFGVMSKLVEFKECAFAESGLTTFKAPGSLLVIGDEAFCRCAELKKVKLNNGLKELGNGVFKQCQIQSIALPNSVTELGS